MSNGAKPGLGIPRKWLVLLIVKPILIAVLVAAVLKYKGLW